MRNWACIDLPTVKRNFELIRERAGGLPVLAVVKSDAYGHGAPRVARLLQRLGCDRLAVATTEEAIALRDSGSRSPIQMLACVPPSDYERVVGEDFIFTLGSIAEVDTLAAIATGARAGGVRRFIIAGGETSGAVAKALNADRLAVGPSIAPGVPWCATLDHQPLALALKSGNFGAETFFADAVEAAP